MSATLDDEIEQLRERAALLKKQLRVHASTLLSARPTRELLSDGNTGDDKVRKQLLELCDAHVAHKQQCLYRAGASVTAFRVRDPDPNAVDGGRVLGLRLDVMMGAQFLRPYYVLLHRDSSRQPTQKRQQQQQPQQPQAQRLRIHRHTVPPCIPLSGLAARYLEGTAAVPAGAGVSGPDLYGFVRALRRALVRYHNRLAVIGDLRRAVQQRSADDSESHDTALADVSGADTEAKQIRLDWADNRTGRLVMDDSGNIQQLVVIGATGIRDRAAARALLAGETTALGLVRRLATN
ncbi:hypothetical protein CMQ_5574 [Grosmannia clavigera kw1407]|uniref:Cenp-o kinetochore centromere component n=1 Tax=Grosmannia clavigera (strain kw1407 / UAMH 11150) TaxID=655863 RepID=F0XTA5_GROCL|nr:uncharacterized protein CMQ_5574 [Grosmannia clavigera kw1407]EFW99153.1 hypothetical protein CMQ_5574 [Grosmannia clavigera kw1407]